MSAKIAVDPAEYEAASSVYGTDLAKLIGNTATKLEHALSDATQMAGNDEAGTTWATEYDAAAAQTVQTMDDLRRAAITTGGLLQQSGFNHARAEAHSDLGGSTPVPAVDKTTYNPGMGACIAVPSAAGGAFDLPDGWELVSQFCGAIWPDGDTTKLKSAATAWRAAATHLGKGHALVADGISTMSTQNSPELANARVICLSLGGYLDDLSGQCRSIAQGCEDLATHIDTAHNDLVNEVIQFVAISVAIQAAGIIIGSLTFGIGEAAAQVGEAAELTAAGVRIFAIIEKLLDAAKTVAGRIGALSLDTTGDGLGIILKKVPQVADVAPVAGKVESLNTVAEALAKSPWSKGAFPRGLEIEADLGGNLPRSFPVIDTWDEVTGVANSIKTLDVTAPTYQKSADFYRKVTGYIDKVANFQGKNFDGVIIDRHDIVERQLTLAIPPGATAAQEEILAQMPSYAAERGVTFILKEIP